MFFIYIIQSIKDHSFYIGYTADLDLRLEFHNNGKSKYTAKKLPWKLVYFEEFSNKSDAIKREKFLKKQRNTDFYNRLIQSFKEP